MNWRPVFQRGDRQHLSAALRHAKDPRSYERLLGVLMVARGLPLEAVAAILQRHRRSIARWIDRYLARRQANALQDAPRAGRPTCASGLKTSQVLRELKRNPLRAGYPRTSWTVDLLALHLNQKYHFTLGSRTLRRRLKQWKLRWKRPRYRYSRRAIHLAQKKGPSFAA